MNRCLLLVITAFAGCADLEGGNPALDGAQDLGIRETDVRPDPVAGLPATDPATQAAKLKRRVDDVLASIPGGHQVSTTEIDYDGLIVTLDPTYSSEKAVSAPALASISCSEGSFCIVVGGTRFNFFECKMWNLTNWLGDAPFNNNQTGHAVARAYNKDLTREVFANTAKSAGTVNVDSWWHFQPCGGPDLPGP
jgi:hypothetical protein